VVDAPAGSRERLKWQVLITVVTISQGEDAEAKATYPFLKLGNYNMGIARWWMNLLLHPSEKAVKCGRLAPKD
jgi:hypothetical protein